jgi:WD40 repeat protein
LNAVGQGFLFDGKTGEKLGELLGHTGAIYACAWSPDGAKLMTSSADKTVRIWDAETRTCTTYASPLLPLLTWCARPRC